MLIRDVLDKLAQTGAPPVSVQGLVSVNVSGISVDSRLVEPGHVFVAVPGVKVDGADYIEAALLAGASAIVTTALRPDLAERCVVLTTSNPRKILAHMASVFFDKQPAINVAVTGTNGKTSVASFTQQIWEILGKKSVSIGTTGIHGCGIDDDGAMTTPDPLVMHGVLSVLSDGGVTHTAMEASSHGIEQNRIDGVNLKAAAFTNLTRDHLDYHGTMESYFQAKALLFEKLLTENSGAVLNADSDTFESLKKIADKRGLNVFDYGVNGQKIGIKDTELIADGQRLKLTVLGLDCEVELPLVGAFQAMNALAALGLVLASDGTVNITEAVASLEHLQGAPGRLQSIKGHPSGAALYVDYAHTPDAVETVLKAVRPHTKGRLVSIVGCGGDRDKGKRPLMAKISAELADATIITDDNPRSEEPSSIRADMLVGVPDHLSDRVQEVGDRRTAIERAVTSLGADDVLVIAGKGHEQGQQVGSETLPFDDVSEATRAIANLKN